MNKIEIKFVLTLIANYKMFKSSAQVLANKLGTAVGHCNKIKFTFL